MDNTTANKTVVIRPTKLLAFICEVIGFALMLTAIVTDYWLTAKENGDIYYYRGLWKECVDSNRSNVFVCTPENPGWVQATGAFAVLSLLAVLVGGVFNMGGLFFNQKLKLMYTIAMIVLCVTAIFAVIAMSIFAGSFMTQEIQSKSAETGLIDWYFDYSYGIGWGAFVFFVTAFIFLLPIMEPRSELSSNDKPYATYQ